MWGIINTDPHKDCAEVMGKARIRIETEESSQASFTILLSPNFNSIQLTNVGSESILKKQGMVAHTSNPISSEG